MRRTILATMLVFVIAGLPTAQAVSQTQGYYTGTLKLGKDQTAPFTNCDSLKQCTNLAGVSLVDLDVGAAVDAAPSGWSVRYEFKDVGGQGYQFTTWRVCLYKASDQLIRCDQDASASYWLMGSVPRQTETIRVLLITGADRDFTLKVWSGNGNF